jgi:two-component system sensor histidine kinase EvgS
VLDFSRIEAGRIDLEHAPFDLRQLISGVVGLFALQVRQRGLVVTVDFDERLAARVVGDVGRLRQVVLNLVSNAIKFTAKGRIGITVDVWDDAPERQRVRLCVSDTGIGVAQDDIERLFAPFHQAEASTTRRFGGSGLGLAICRRLVELFGGEIAMTSQAGEGTCVTVILALEVGRVGTTDEAVEPEAVPRADGGILDILVAEDNATNRELIAAQLERLGHRYRIVADGSQALALATTSPVDVLLTDLHMPVMDGYALTRALRGKGMTVRIVAMTANAMPGEKERCLAMGMDGFVTKPLRLAALRNVLSPATAHEAPPAPWDVDAWRDTYGDLALLPAMVARFEMSVREDLARVHALNGPAEAADWVHRIAGGMRVFGQSPEGALAEKLEHELRYVDGAAAMHRLPELSHAIERYLARLRDAVGAPHES